MEIVLNMGIWDIRTFHLLKTIPELNYCWTSFSPDTHVMFAHRGHEWLEPQDAKMAPSCFSVYDAHTYDHLHTKVCC
jgi:hypothetical protein